MPIPGFVARSGTYNVSAKARCCCLNNPYNGIVNQFVVYETKIILDGKKACFHEISDTTCFLRQQYRVYGRYLYTYTESAQSATTT